MPGLAAALVWMMLALGADAADARKADTPADFAEVRGGRHRLPGPGDCKAVVLIFVGHDCPISNAYSPEIARLCKEFGPRKVAFCVVYADADLGRKDAARHAEEFGLPCPAILDPQMTLALRVGATVKPEAAVLSPKGERLYLGRIDDRYVDFGRRREHPTSRDLRDALAAVLAGRPVATPRTKAIGCDIDLPQKPR